MNTNKISRILTGGGLAAALPALLATMARATGNFQNSNIARGTENLLRDVSAWLIGIGLVAGTLAAVYFLIRRAMADEVDGKMWTKRIVAAIVCGVSVSLVGGVISMISGYYG